MVREGKVEWHHTLKKLQLDSRVQLVWTSAYHFKGLGTHVMVISVFRTKRTN